MSGSPEVMHAKDTCKFFFMRSYMLSEPTFIRVKNPGIYRKPNTKHVQATMLSNSIQIPKKPFTIQNFDSRN
jgi:hypothetical protein